MGLTDFQLTDIIPDSISLTFVKLQEFIDSITIFGLNIYNFILVIIFFGLVIGSFWGLFKLIRFYNENKNTIQSFINIK